MNRNLRVATSGLLCWSCIVLLGLMSPGCSSVDSPPEDAGNGAGINGNGLDAGSSADGGASGEDGDDASPCSPLCRVFFVVEPFSLEMIVPLSLEMVGLVVEVTRIFEVVLSIHLVWLNKENQVRKL